MELPMLSTFVYQVVLLALVLWAVMTLSQGSRVVSVLLFIVLPVVILPLILQTEWNGWFNLAKSLTMIFVGAYMTLMRVGLRHRSFTTFFSLLFLLNIVEAGLQDLASGHWLNVGAALLVITMLPSLARASIDEGDELVYPTSWPFILSYSVWNFCFLYSYESVHGHRGDYALVTAVLLLLPILIALRRGTERYTQARAYSLAFCITMTDATVLQIPEAWPLTGGSLYSPLGHQVVSAVSLAVALGSWVVLLRRFPSQSRETLLGAVIVRLRCLGTTDERRPMTSVNSQPA